MDLGKRKSDVQFFFSIRTFLSHGYNGIRVLQEMNHCSVYY